MDRRPRALELIRSLAIAAALAACSGTQRGDPDHATPGPYTQEQREEDARTVVRIYERAARNGRDAYLSLWDFDEVGAVERLLQRYDLYRGDPLGEPEDVRRSAPPEPFSHEREQRNVTNLFPWLGSGPVGGGACHPREPHSEYARTLITYEPLPPEDQERWGPLRDRVNALFACGGLVGLRCDHGRGAIAVAYARIPCHDGTVTAESRLRVVTVYVDDVQ